MTDHTTVALMLSRVVPFKEMAGQLYQDTIEKVRESVDPPTKY